MSERNAVIVDGPLLTHRWIDEGGEPWRVHVDLRTVAALFELPPSEGERELRLTSTSGASSVLRLESDFQVGLVVSSWEQVKKAEGAPPLVQITEPHSMGYPSDAVEKAVADALRSSRDGALEGLVCPPGKALEPRMSSGHGQHTT